MKNLIVILLVLAASVQAFGQKKGKVDARDLKIDSLTQASNNLSAQLDSVSGELAIYYGVYTAIKEKVIKHDFDPAKITLLIDSLKTSRDSTFSWLATTSASLEDSLCVVKKENKELKSKLDSLGTGSEAEKAQAISDLKALKELLDAKILSQEEFDIKKEKLLAKL